MCGTGRKRVVLLSGMFVKKLLSCMMIIGRIAAQHDSVQSQELLTHLDYFGKTHIIRNILHDYSNVSESWTNPEYEQYDQRLIATLQSYVVEMLQNETESAPYGSGNNVKLFTNFCGPGNWAVDGEITQNPYFNKIDQCCKDHDECPFSIVGQNDYQYFPGLPHKPQLFTR